jgi:glycyl-tRNA synthetase beta chain
MSASHQFLFELLCEEIPANALPAMRAQLVDGFTKALSEAGFSTFSVRAVSTVRRVVVHVTGLPERQADRKDEVTGPPVKAAFAADGAPTQAAIGFAKGQGVSVDELRVVKGSRGDVVAVTKLVVGESTPELLAKIARSVVPALHFPKTMRWGKGEYVFVRPVHNIVALWGRETLDEVVPLELFSITSCASTSGHRVVAPGRIRLDGAGGLPDYLARLESAGVVVDHEARHARIEARARELATEVGCTVRPDPELVAELVELLEFPGIVRGEVAMRFLDLPEEVLVTTLRHHQKCLVLQNEERVAPYFLAVCDRPDDPEGHVRRGCEWVAGARLTDAEFFFAQDRKQPLAAKRERLDKVVFHQKLGTFLEKAGLVGALAGQLATAAELEVNADELGRAAELAKVDLVTAMVGEFPELQGVVGGIYAGKDGETESVALAVYDQYRPAGLDGPIPRGLVGALLGVADRLDTLTGLFAAGEVPSGSKDPFALRRATLAVVRICAEFPLPVDLRAALDAALELRSRYLKGERAATLDALRSFVLERERYVLTSVVGVRADVADAVLGANWGVVPDDVARARALAAVREQPVFDALAVAFKRVRNMVGKSGAGLAGDAPLVEPVEKALLAALEDVESAVGGCLAEGDYEAALKALATLAEPLDRFFAGVLVLCEDAKLKAARLGLLARVETLFLRLADVSRLAPEAK